ncbi:MAG: SGNH/GDSL hydrolase family protein [Deltaproteobacteria bacterium]|nr:SGNH/GDSL hydrolase family protein [Deltaproteobacteria bacterium]
MDATVPQEQKRSAGISSQCSRVINSHRILFAHMSVGNDIMAGLASAGGALHEPIAIHAVDAGAAASVSPSPGISHFKIGANAQPLQKFENFKTFLLFRTNGLAFDLVGIKLCYVDIKKNTDILAVFNEYAALVKAVTERYPHIRFVHFTVPLTTHYCGLKSRLKHALLGDQDNMQRSAYNELLRQAYKGEPVIDIARTESTFPDGRRMEHAYFQARYYSLLPAYTADGGHLNDAGRARAAQVFANGLCKALCTIMPQGAGGTQGENAR